MFLEFLNLCCLDSPYPEPPITSWSELETKLTLLFVASTVGNQKASVWGMGTVVWVQWGRALRNVIWYPLTMPSFSFYIIAIQRQCGVVCCPGEGLAFCTQIISGLSLSCHWDATVWITLGYTSSSTRILLTGSILLTSNSSGSPFPQNLGKTRSCILSQGQDPWYIYFI